jgi:VWFA-related protein
MTRPHKVKGKSKKAKVSGHKIMLTRLRSSYILFLLLLPFAFLLLPLSSVRAVNDEQGIAPQASPTPNAPEDEEVEIDEGDVVSVSTSEVLLPVTVRDANGQLIKTLTRKDFRVFEDGREQPLSDLALRQVPVDVVLMLDASSSVANNLDDFRRAVEEFAVKLAPEDRLSLIKFDDRVELLQDWTQSRVQLRRALRRIVPGVFTRFNDALVLASKEQLQQARGRHAIIVLTDGLDSGRGQSTLEAALHALLEAQATVYVVSNTEIERARKRAELDTLLANSISVIRFNELRIGDLREGLRVLDISEQNLERLTAATGGRLYKPVSFESLDKTYAEVAEELRHQYALYYTPLNKARDGRLRRVRVETANPAFKVSTRLGYYAPRR